MVGINAKVIQTQQPSKHYTRQSQKVKRIYYLLHAQKSMTNANCIISQNNHLFLMHTVWFTCLPSPSAKKVFDCDQSH